LDSITLTWELGKAVYKCRDNHTDPVKKIANITNGYEVFTGKVVDINREFGSETTKGFTLGQITLEGMKDYKNRIAKIDFQNEWLNLRIDDKIMCMTPDLVVVLDPEIGEPIRTDIIKYGYRAKIILIPANERMRTKKGIETFGPRYFGYDMDYIPVEKLITKNFKKINKVENTLI
jgi:DUF917 family protein